MTLFADIITSLKFKLKILSEKFCSLWTLYNKLSSVLVLTLISVLTPEPISILKKKILFYHYLRYYLTLKIILNKIIFK